MRYDAFIEVTVNCACSVYVKVFFLNLTINNCCTSFILRPPIFELKNSNSPFLDTRIRHQ